jgi:glycosyltransferase involved in cell wall biosynthesis
MKNKSIVIDARELRTTTGRYVERLLHYLQELDHGHDYTVLLKPQDIACWVPTNPRFKALACPHKEFTFDEQLDFKKQLDSLSADLVHFTMVQQPVLYKGKVVTTIQDLTTVRFSNPSKNPIVFKLKRLVYRSVIQRVAKKSLAIITPTEFVKTDLMSFTGINPNKITVTLESADPINAASELVTALVGQKFLMYVGRPTPHKNLERLIEAFVLLKGQHPDLKLVLAGKKDANYKRIEATVVARNIANVVFTDFVSEGQLRWLYGNCEVYVFPSLSEGFGLPGLEAMVHGAPVVSSNATCLPEVYGNAAHYFDPLYVQAMSDAINEVLTDKALRQRLIEAGRVRAAEFSWTRMAEQTLEIYRRVLDEN